MNENKDNVLHMSIKNTTKCEVLDSEQRRSTQDGEELQLSFIKDMADFCLLKHHGRLSANVDFLNNVGKMLSKKMHIVTTLKVEEHMNRRYKMLILSKCEVTRDEEDLQLSIDRDIVNYYLMDHHGQLNVDARMYILNNVRKMLSERMRIVTMFLVEEYMNRRYKILVEDSLRLKCFSVEQKEKYD